MDIGKLIEDAKQKAKISTDSELAKQLYCHKSHISEIRNGAKLPGDDIVYRLAKMAGRNPVETVFLVWKENKPMSAEMKDVAGDILRLLEGRLPKRYSDQ